MNPEDHSEVARRTINWLFDFVAIKPERESAQKAVTTQGEFWRRRHIGPWAVGQRRLQLLAIALQRPEVAHITGQDIAREYGRTKQAINLDAQRIKKELGIALPTAHK